MSNIYDIEAKMALCALAGMGVEKLHHTSPRQVRLLRKGKYYVKVWLSWPIEKWAFCIEDILRRLAADRDGNPISIDEYKDIDGRVWVSMAYTIKEIK